jgi:hypothetical protein
MYYPWLSVATRKLNPLFCPFCNNHVKGDKIEGRGTSAGAVIGFLNPKHPHPRRKVEQALNYSNGMRMRSPECLKYR